MQQVSSFEPSTSAALEQHFRQQSCKLVGNKIFLLGATSSLGPFKRLAKLGTTIVCVAMKSKKMEKLVKDAEASTYAEVAYTDHMIKCMVYLILNVIICGSCVYGYFIAWSAKVTESIQGRCSFWGGIGAFCSIVACIDVDAHADRLPYVIYNVLYSLNGACLVICVINVNTYMMKSLREKGKTGKTSWDYMRTFSEGFVWTVEVSFVVIENFIEEGAGVVNGTIQALRNLLTGLVLLFWLVAIIYNGLLIVRKLDTNADASAQKAQKQVLFYVKMLSMGSFVGFAAKLLSVFNIGKTLYARPPCEGGGLFHFNHFQLALLTSFGKYTF
ncbi:hypothetical protein TrLO_g2417 [Triparma laevis f. longispina]|uniref:Uncharacterized protein n=1 Tax=Triparma laevis f. longispina TaxID=1714387 RepID=A0A9W7FLJ2_9STRA|nr:hypothetical protein TrLO_g2417 [Triparma laevis f. longispina]